MGTAVTTKAMIDGIKKAGFNSIRIPVSWSNMMSSDGNYIIDASYFKRVDEIISYAFANDMYVIINDHYDGGWWEPFLRQQERLYETLQEYVDTGCRTL